MGVLISLWKSAGICRLRKVAGARGHAPVFLHCDIQIHISNIICLTTFKKTFQNPTILYTVLKECSLILTAWDLISARMFTYVRVSVMAQILTLTSESACSTVARVNNREGETCLNKRPSHIRSKDHRVLAAVDRPFITSFLFSLSMSYCKHNIRNGTV